MIIIGSVVADFGLAVTSLIQDSSHLLNTRNGRSTKDVEDEDWRVEIFWGSVEYKGNEVRVIAYLHIFVTAKLVPLLNLAGVAGQALSRCPRKRSQMGNQTILTMITSTRSP
jgi:hypothetical protein